MNKPLKALSILVPTFVFVITIAFFIVSATQAATLAAVYVFLSRIKVNLDGTGTNTVQMILAIDTATTIASGGTITIEFDDAEDSMWCRTAGALAITTPTASAVDLAGQNWDIDSALPDTGTTLTAECTQGGAGSSDTITISNVGGLTAGTTYGVQLANGTSAGVLGTDDAAGEHVVTISVREGGVPIDSKSFKIFLVADDVVHVTATVSAMPTINCTIGTNSVNLGILYPGGTYTTGSHTITTYTTAEGYYWAVYGTGDGSTDAGLWNGTTLLRSGTTATLDLTDTGVNGFGMTFSDPDGAGAATVTTNFVDTTVGTFGTIDRLYSGAKMVLYQQGTQVTPEDSTVTYGAKAQPTATTGTYNEYVYFVCGAYY